MASVKGLSAWMASVGVSSGTACPLSNVTVLGAGTHNGNPVSFTLVAVNGVAGLVSGIGGRVRKIQTGFVRSYALTLFSGATVVLFVFLVRGNL